MTSKEPLEAGDQSVADLGSRGSGDETAMSTLMRLPAVRVLAELPVPVAAVTDQGAILFANEALATMLGFAQDALGSMNLNDVLEAPDTSLAASSVTGECAEVTVALAHAEGSTVRAVMSRSLLRQDDDHLALVLFQDLTDRLWLEGP